MVIRKIIFATVFLVSESIAEPARVYEAGWEWLSLQFSKPPLITHVTGGTSPMFLITNQNGERLTVSNSSIFVDCRSLKTNSSWSCSNEGPLINERPLPPQLVKALTLMLFQEQIEVNYYVTNHVTFFSSRKNPNLTYAVHATGLVKKIEGNISGILPSP